MGQRDTPNPQFGRSIAPLWRKLSETPRFGHQVGILLLRRLEAFHSQRPRLPRRRICRVFVKGSNYKIAGRKSRPVVCRLHVPPLSIENVFYRRRNASRIGARLFDSVARMRILRQPIGGAGIGNGKNTIDAVANRVRSTFADLFICLLRLFALCVGIGMALGDHPLVCLYSICLVRHRGCFVGSRNSISKRTIQSFGIGCLLPGHFGFRLGIGSPRCQYAHTRTERKCC